MKRIVPILLLLFVSKTLLAEHITGGEMFYTFTGMDGSQYRYRVTLKLYRDYFSTGADLDGSAAIGIFDKSNNRLVWNQLVPMSKREDLVLGSPDRCISDPPVVHYEVGYYEFSVSLPASANGYTVAYQRCCRISGISNLIGSGSTGATYTADIPGTSRVSTAPANNSARFTGRDTVILCGGYPFTYSFSAVDADPLDELRYSFCEAWLGGAPGNLGASTPNPPASPSYSSVTYNAPYHSGSPLGSSVTIDPVTGIISGSSPRPGIYVVTVCVEEIRNGIVIAVQRKDLQVKIGGCNIAKAQLEAVYPVCDDFTESFSNLISSPLISSYYWDFGDPASGLDNLSSDPTPTHTFSAAGDYTIKLVTNRNQDCSDSTTAIVKVWPGFFPALVSDGVCVTNPVLFEDATTLNYGIVDSWSWDFGDETTIADVSAVSTPSWTYAGAGVKNVTLTVTSSKGCKGSVTEPVPMIDRPPITLAFRDTLICIPDALQLQASGAGIFSWTPAAGMANPGTGTPTVSPTATTTYHVQLNDQGCINNDSVKVRVVSFVTLEAMADTTICRTDPVQLTVTSDGLRYQWAPADAFSDATLQNPTAVSGNTETYTVTATIGSCLAEKQIHVIAVPYPIADAGPDTTICYNTPASLHGWHDGSSFAWSPASSLLNAGTLSPLAWPVRSQQYVLTSLDTKGCPKPGRDTVLITVLGKIYPYAGRDTLVVIGQPLQLNAEGGTSYAWLPPTGLSNPGIKNPVGLYGPEIDSVRYWVRVFNDAGCYDSASVKVTVFKTAPSIFVPTAFTPNNDGLNDEFRPVAAGIQKINYFRVFNRWGQLVFHTTQTGRGWDGTIGGVPQGSNAYVWMVSAVDYLGKPFFLKGTVTLIR
ncbi:MAG: PKD domain-containing protein [Chitinophagaceae bacterium]